MNLKDKTIVTIGEPIQKDFMKAEQLGGTKKEDK
jgi:hypothetical protein